MNLSKVPDKKHRRLCTIRAQTETGWKGSQLGVNIVKFIANDNMKELWKFDKLSDEFVKRDK